MLAICSKWDFRLLTADGLLVSMDSDSIGDEESIPRRCCGHRRWEMNR